MIRSLQSLIGALVEIIGDTDITGVPAKPGVPVGAFTLYCTVIAYGEDVLVATTIAEEFHPTPPVIPVITTGHPRTIDDVGAAVVVNWTVEPELTIRADGVKFAGVAVL